MSLSLIAPPAAEPVSLADVKAHLKIDGGEEDALLSGLIVAARQAIEAKFQIAVMAQSWRLSLDALPAGALLLPLSPVLSIDSVGVTSNGVTQALSPAAYEAQTGAIGRVRINVARPGALVVVFTAGWADANAVPEALKLAIRTLAAHLYENREGAAAMPDLSPFVAPYRQVRL